MSPVMLRLLGKRRYWSSGGGKGGGGGTSVNYGEVCSMLPESLALPQIKLHNFPSLMSAVKRRVTEGNTSYSRAWFQKEQLTLFQSKKGSQAITFTI